MFRTSQQGVVKVVGGDAPLSGDNIAAALRSCDDALLHGQPKIVFDLGGIPLIDSAGLGLLLDVRDRCLRRGGALVLAGASPLCLDILSATGVAEELAIFDDAIAAVGSFAQ